MKQSEEELEKKADHEALFRWSFLVTGFTVAFTVLALYLMISWNLLAESLRFPALSFWSAIGLLGLVLFVAAVPTAVYLTCVKEFEG
jgi:hypothetical protein